MLISYVYDDENTVKEIRYDVKKEAVGSREYMVYRKLYGEEILGYVDKTIILEGNAWASRDARRK